MKSYIFIFSLYFSLSTIYLPFTQYFSHESQNEEHKDLTSLYFLSFKDNILYTDLFIGEPIQKISSILDSSDYGSFIYEHMCDIPSNSYTSNKSTTFQITEKLARSYRNLKNCGKITERIRLFTNEKLSSNIIVDNISLIYSKNLREEQLEKHYTYKENTCLNIGLQLTWFRGYEVSNNLIMQLKEKNLINTYDWTIKYISNTSGYLLIGEELHNIYPSNYFEQQYIKVGGVNKVIVKDWVLSFDKSYYTVINMTDYIQNNKFTYFNRTFYSYNSNIKININLGVIIGTEEYEKNIRNDFFNFYIYERLCFTKKTEKGEKFYYCIKDVWNDIQKYFPTLKFLMKNFETSFEFDYNDLFIEKNGYYFFLIYFIENTFQFSFTFGSILLKKYMLTFNYDSKTIGFYNLNIPGGKSKHNTDNKGEIDKNYKYKKIRRINSLRVIILIILMIIFCFIGFYLGKIIYYNYRKKRINEIEDNFDYLQKINNENNKKLNLEMMTNFNSFI